MCLALVMVVAGVSMLANALPHLAAGLGASQSQQQWIVDAYALTLAALLLPAGALGDRFGRRGALIIGLSSSASPSALAVDRRLARRSSSRYRALMGIGAALIMPGTLSTITSVFPPEERAKAVGIWAGFAGTGGTLGILASGALLEQLLLGLDLRRHRRARARRARRRRRSSCPPPSRASTSASTRSARCSPPSASALLVLGIIEGPERGLDRPADARRARRRRRAASAAFIRFELRSEAPLLDPRLFRHRGFATGSASLFLQFFAMFGFFFVSLQFLQLVLGYSTLTAALALLPMSVVILPLSAVAGTLSETLRPQARRRRRAGDLGRRASCSSPTLGTGSGLLAVPRGHPRDRRRRRPRDDPGDQRHRRLAPAGEAGRRLRGQRHRPRARRRVRCRGARAARSTSATATTSPTTSAACPPTIAAPGAGGAGDRAAASPQVPGGDGARRTPRRRRSPSACATPSCSVPACSSIGALFVWFRGASAAEEVAGGRPRRAGGRRRLTLGSRR